MSMLKLEGQACEAKYAVKLCNLGVKQESLLYWWHDNVTNKYGIRSDKGAFKAYSAFTVAELGAMLPPHIVSYKVKDCPEWYCTRKHDTLYEVSADTEADARAKMLIYLIENNFIDSKDIKG